MGETSGTKNSQELWIEKFQESIENYESIQLKVSSFPSGTQRDSNNVSRLQDMLKCTPLYSSLSMRRCSSSRLMTRGHVEHRVRLTVFSTDFHHLAFAGQRRWLDVRRRRPTATKGWQAAKFKLIDNLQSEEADMKELAPTLQRLASFRRNSPASE